MRALIHNRYTNRFYEAGITSENNSPAQSVIDDLAVKNGQIVLDVCIDDRTPVYGKTYTVKQFLKTHTAIQTDEKTLETILKKYNFEEYEI